MRKFIFLFCAFLFAYLLSGAQAVQIDKTFGNQGYCLDTNGMEISLFDFDTAGNIIAVGYRYSDNWWHTTLAKYNKDGITDSSFGLNGIVNSIFDSTYDVPYGMAMQHDNKILVACSPGGLARYNSNGSADSSFGSYGLVKPNYDSTDLFQVIYLQNSKIMAAGTKKGDTCIIFRINTDGSPDNTFGTNGWLKVSDTNFNLSLWHLTQLSDGNFLLSGNEHNNNPDTKLTAVKIDSNGNWIHSFGKNGKLIIDSYPAIPGGTAGSETFTKAIELPDGRILFSGWDSTWIFLRVNNDGTPDSSFGTYGIAHTYFPCMDFTMQPDGKIAIASTEEMSDYNWGYSFRRLDSLGNIDITFNNAGRFDIDPSPSNDYPECIKMQDGKLLVGGSSEPNDHGAFTMIRIDLNPALSIRDKGSKNDVLIYPNPSNGNITITGQSSNARIEIFDLNGRKIHSATIASQNERLILPLPDGIYLLKYATTNNTIVQKLVIRH